jgi:hypothetical protein
MQVNSGDKSDPKLDRLERAIRRARLALGWERAWPRLVPVVSVLGLYVLLSWLGFWRLGGDWLRLGTLAVLSVVLVVAASGSHGCRSPAARKRFVA